MKEKILLPRRLVAREAGAIYAAVCRALRGSGEGGPVPARLDFRLVEDFDASALAFMRIVKTKSPGTVFENVSGPLAAAFASSRAGDLVRPEEAPEPSPPRHPLARIGAAAHRAVINARNFLALAADAAHHAIGFLVSRRGVHPGEIGNQLYFMAYRSFPIVCTMIFLIGITISLISAAQLRLFGADLLLADLVGVAMIQELVPIMVGIILAGKVGAAVTAEIATMSVLEEIDALRTMGVSPERYLMVPRLLAITLAVPLLVALADAAGVFGGMLVGRLVLGIPFGTFYRQMMTSVFLRDVLIALGKTIVFGWTVVLAGGFKGFFVGRSAGEVGRATTESVVLSISLIIFLDCLFAVIFYL